MPAPAGAHRNAVRRSSSRAIQERTRGDSDRVATRRAPCGNAARGAPSDRTVLDHGRADACRRGTCRWAVRNAGRGYSAPGQGGRRQRSPPRRHAPVCLPQRRANGLTATWRAAFRRAAPGREGGANEARRVVTRQWPYRNAARSFSSNRARQGRRRQRSPPRRHAPMELPQRGAQLFIEPRPAGSEAPLMPAASPRANGLIATPRAASRRTAPGRERGAGEACRVATRQWPYRNAARSFSSNHLSACAGE